MVTYAPTTTPESFTPVGTSDAADSAGPRSVILPFAYRNPRVAVSKKTEPPIDVQYPATCPDALIAVPAQDVFGAASVPRS